MARKRYAGNAGVQASLNEVSGMLAALDIGQASSLLDSVAPAGDFDGNGDVDAGDHDLWRQSFGAETILAGSAADGNYDGVVDAADYVVWRKSLGAGNGTASAAASVPESAASALVGLAAMTLYCRQVLHRGRNGQP
jgi:hypothetical protein